MALVKQSMKNPILAVVAATLFTSTTWAGAPNSPTTSPVRIEIAAGTPTLTIKNPRIDVRDGKIRGTAYVNFGYAAPRAAHVHAYALNSRGEVVGGTCDALSGSILSPHPRLSRPRRDSFSMRLPAGTQIHEIRLVAHTGRHGDC